MSCFGTSDPKQYFNSIQTGENQPQKLKHWALVEREDDMTENYNDDDHFD